LKSFGGRATVNRVKQECDKYVADNLNSIKYDLFCEIVQDDFRQAEAVMLYALMLHGYGTKRLQRVHKWMKEVMEMPEILGKTPTCADCQKVLTERHGINFDEITVRVESREQFEKR
jgi:hypothetical protein